MSLRSLQSHNRAEIDQQIRTWYCTEVKRTLKPEQWATSGLALTERYNQFLIIEDQGNTPLTEGVKHTTTNGMDFWDHGSRLAISLGQFLYGAPVHLAKKQQKRAAFSMQAEDDDDDEGGGTALNIALAIRLLREAIAELIERAYDRQWQGIRLKEGTRTLEVKAWIDAYRTGQSRGQDIGIYNFTPKDPEDFERFRRLEKDPETAFQELRAAARRATVELVAETHTEQQPTSR
ncbi:MAG: hypothetical protein A3J38_08705 [Gammaproteobacteria bacterium RIFCSPHIGHO2_12_FULL_45_9]|nr:MAG: hypothetical protein A3J38_08705 [Gammaproteobacteria bacterium RIFCSPHIGHO2_12_FULL_45_9]